MDNSDLRDLFAGQAMQAIIQVAKDDVNTARSLSIDCNWHNLNNNFGAIAKCAYSIADAMIEERGKPKQGPRPASFK